MRKYFIILILLIIAIPWGEGHYFSTNDIVDPVHDHDNACISIEEPGTKGLRAADFSPPVKNYYDLRDSYSKWKMGRFGSKKYHKRMLRRLLVSLLGHYIQTDFDYILHWPEGVVYKKVRCDFTHCRWLYFHGKLDTEEITKKIGKKHSKVKRWLRQRRPVAVYGKIRKFRFGRDRYGETIDLFLYNVKILVDNGVFDKRKNEK
ncbi:hypothetical protein ACFL20_00610 [Spirochaetota bacterium]